MSWCDLDEGLAGPISMVVSRVNSCRECYAASRMLLRLQGKSEGEVSQIDERLAQGWEDSRTDRLSGSPDASAAPIRCHTTKIGTRCTLHLLK